MTTPRPERPMSAAETMLGKDWDPGPPPGFAGHIGGELTAPVAPLPPQRPTWQPPPPPWAGGPADDYDPPPPERLRPVAEPEPEPDD